MAEINPHVRGYFIKAERAAQHRVHVGFWRVWAGRKVVGGEAMKTQAAIDRIKSGGFLMAEFDEADQSLKYRCVPGGGRKPATSCLHYKNSGFEVKQRFSIRGFHTPVVAAVA
jgi:hypothetical protein